jgi:hypothetical protein
MPYRVNQPNFSKGEISEELVARMDVSTYSTALRKATNVIILKYGGITKRPGTRLVAEVYDDDGVRLVPFQFSLSQTYALEMGQGYMRVAALGGLVIEDKLTIMAIVRGGYTQITANYHEYAVGDQVYFEGVNGATDLNGKVGRVLAVYDEHTFTVDIDSSTYGALTTDEGGVERTGPPPPPPPPPPVPPPAVPPTPPYLGGWNIYNFRVFF